MNDRGGIIGVSDHGGWAVLVTVARDGTLLDRRRVELVAEGLPKLPHHYDGQRLPIEQAVALVGEVRVSAERHAGLALDEVAAVVPAIRGIALRTCQPLPLEIAQRIQDRRARNVADWVMYRMALASGARARGCLSTGTTRRPCSVRPVRHSGSTPSTPASLPFEGPSGRPGTWITSSRWPPESLRRGRRPRSGPAHDRLSRRHRAQTAVLRAYGSP